MMTHSDPDASGCGPERRRIKFSIRSSQGAYFWLTGKEAMEKKMVTIMGYIGSTVRIEAEAQTLHLKLPIEPYRILYKPYTSPYNPIESYIALCIMKLLEPGTSKALTP